MAQLPAVGFVRGTLAAMAPALAEHPALLMQLTTAQRALDMVTAQQQGTPVLEAAAAREALALADEIEAAGVAASGIRLSALATPPDHARLLAALAQIQGALLTRDAAGSGPLVRRIAAIERACTDTHRADVRAQEARAASATAQVARNDRAFDPVALTAFIRKALPAEADATVTAINTISGGHSKFTAIVSLEGGRDLPPELVMRADAANTYGGASSVDEYRLIQTLHRNGVQVPVPIAADEDGETFDTRFMLGSKVEGGSVGHMFMLPARDPALCRDVAGQLARFHRIPVDELPSGLDNMGGTSSGKARAWIAQARRDHAPLAMPSPVFEAAFAWLEANAGLVDAMPQGLVHGDVHLANMLAADSRITAILDWEFAHLGNPAYDLGYFYDQAVALDSWDAFLAAYEQAGGIRPDEQQLDYAILFAATRLGVMTCQSYSEFNAGETLAMSGAFVIGNFFYAQTIERMSRMLDKVL